MREREGRERKRRETYLRMYRGFQVFLKSGLSGPDPEVTFVDPFNLSTDSFATVNSANSPMSAISGLDGTNKSLESREERERGRGEGERNGKKP